MMKITFPDGSIREYAKGTTAMQIAESISQRLARAAKTRALVRIEATGEAVRAKVIIR